MWHVVSDKSKHKQVCENFSNSWTNNEGLKVFHTLLKVIRKHSDVKLVSFDSGIDFHSEGGWSYW